MVRETTLRTCDGCGGEFDAADAGWWTLSRAGAGAEKLFVLGEAGGPKDPPYSCHKLFCVLALLRRNEKEL